VNHTATVNHTTATNPCILREHFLGFGFTQGYNEIDQGQYNDLKKIKGYASGSSLIIKKEVIEKIEQQSPNLFKIKTNQQEYSVKTVLIATGSSRKN